MRKIYLLLSALFIQLLAISQTDIVIGSGGTTGNSGTTYPAPLQDYYEGSRAQYLYLASELANAGMTPGTISAIKYDVQSLNNFSGTIEQFTVSIGSTGTSSLTSNSWESGTTVVYGPEDYVPATGTNVITFTTPFTWNGSDNIVIEICNGDPNNASAITYTQNATIPWTTGLAFNGSHNYRADNLGNLCGSVTTTNTGLQTTRPDITFEFTAATGPGCYLPSGTAISNITSGSATASWNAPASGSPVTMYNWEIRTAGAGGSGSAGLVTSGSTAATTVNFSSLSAATTYYFYVQSNCGAGSTSVWSGAYSFLTACNPVTTFPWTENFDGVTIPGLPLCFNALDVNADGDKWQTYDTYGTGGSKAAGLYTDFNAGNNDDYLILPAMTLTGTQRFRFSIRARSATEPNDYRVVISTTDTDPASFSEIVPLTTVSNTTQTPINWIDLSSYTGTVYLAIHVPSGGLDGYYLYADDLVVENIPTCDVPTDIMHSAITATGAQLDWIPPATGSPASYDVYYSTSSVAPSGSTTPTNAGITATTLTLSTLAASTKYFVWIRSNCGSGGLSVWSAADSFYTACLPVPAFSENFDGVTTPSLPTCWSSILRGATLSTFATVTTTTGNAFSMPNAVAMYNSSSTSTDDIILVSPPVSNLAAGTYQLSFYAKNSSLGQDIEVGTLDNNSATATFTPIETVTVTTAYQKFTVSFAGYSGTDTYIGIRRLNAGTYTYVYVDNVNWELIPSCIEPNALMISNIASTSAQLDWTAPSASSPASYEVYYSTSNIAPTATTTPTAVGITSTTYNLGILATATQYFVWVRSNCGSGSTSEWSVADSFTTACNAVPAFSENFDGVTTPALPSCWSSILRGATLSLYATVNTTTGNSYSTPNAVSLYNSSSTSTDDIILVSPNLSNLATGTYQLSFYAKNSVLGQDIEVGTLDNSSATATFTPLQTITVTTSYQKFIVSFASYSGTDTHIGIRRLNTSTYSYVYVDNINWELIPACSEPLATVVSNITATDAQIDWTAPATGSPASYELYTSTSNSAPNSSTTPTVTGITGTTYSLSTLLSSTQYYVWVRSNCGAGGVSNWNVADSFYTECNGAAVNIPYTQNFESAVVPGFPTCTSVENVGTGNNWVTISNPGSGFTNKTLKYGYNSTSAADAWFYTQGVNLDAGISYRLSFKYGNNSTTYVESMNVSYGTAAAAASMTDLIVDYPTITGAVPDTSYTDFTPATTGVYYIGFHVYSIADQYNLFVDNIDLSLTSTAPVTLLNFRGARQGAINMLSWATATEQTNKGFELQRSATGEVFSTIGFVSSKAVNGNSSSTLNYNYADEKPLAGNNYYRLKQVDKDGKASVSNVVLVKGAKTNAIVLSSVYPNPAKNILNVILSAPANDKVSVIVTDLAGKVIMQTNSQLITGDNNLTIHVGSLPSGTYLVKAVCNNGCETATSKFVKQ